MKEIVFQPVYQDTKERLVCTAIELIRRDGLRNFSVRTLAEACGLSHHAPYRHFGNKDTLLAVVAVRILERLFEYLDHQINAHPQEEAYLVLCREMVCYLLEHRECRAVFHVQNLPESIRGIVREECHLEERVRWSKAITVDYLSRCNVPEQQMHPYMLIVQSLMIGLIQNIRRDTFPIGEDVRETVKYIITEKLGLKPEKTIDKERLR